MLYPAIALAARELAEPVAILEAGAAAGLNLLFDRYWFDYAAAGTAGDPASPVRARCQVRGRLRPPISQPAPQVAARLGIDAHPLDIRDADQVLWLRSLVWPEHHDRVQLLESAIAVARRDPPPLDHGTLPEAVTEAAASIAPDRPLVVFHSATLAYLTPDERDRFGALLAELARDRALAWVALEGPGAAPAAGERARRAEVWANFGLPSLTRFDQGRRTDRLLGRVEMHGRWLQWLDAASAAPPDPKYWVGPIPSTAYSRAVPDPHRHAQWVDRRRERDGGGSATWSATPGGRRRQEGEPRNLGVGGWMQPSHTWQSGKRGGHRQRHQQPRPWHEASDRLPERPHGGRQMTVRDDARGMHDQLVRLRRDLHREPEVGLDVPRTQQRVLSELDRLPLEVATGSALSSVTAVLRGGNGRGRRAVLLRADMDALPVVERTGLEFAATGERMHACGHDLHTAMLVGAARLLAAHREELGGDVVLMFQPGEEGYDGARLMIEAGVLDAAGRRADAAYALHVTTRLPAGVFATRPGTMLAAGGRLRATVHGTGGHGGLPHRARDPVPAACEMVTALQTFVTRTFDVFDPVVITVGTFHAGTAPNVIPDAASFEATLRSFSRHSHRKVLSESVRLCRGIAAAHGLDLQIEATEGHPVTVNDAAEVDLVASLVREEYGEQRFVQLSNPLAATEDFSRVLDAVPGALISLGACPRDADPATAPANHSSDAAFDDSVLADGAALYAHLAMRRLARTNGDGPAASGP